MWDQHDSSTSWCFCKVAAFANLKKCPKPLDNSAKVCYYILIRAIYVTQWQKLVERVAVLPETHENSLAFSLMMIKLCDCMNCDLGSYKASLGCSTCARRAIGAIKGPDIILMRHFEKAKEEVLAYLESVGLKKEKAA
jgi:hypothetical protein